MKRKNLYLLLCAAGAILPYWQFVPWLIEHGFDIPRLVSDLFANRISAFFGMDVLVSAVVVFVFIAAERWRLGSYWWLPAGAVLTVGISLGLPLLLYLLEDKTRSTPLA